MDNLLYEVILPPIKWQPEQLSERTDQILSLLKEEGIRSINLPEVVSESRNTERTLPLLEKVDTLEFIDHLLLKNPSLIPILNIITVFRYEKELLQWVQTAYQKGVRHLVLVGGEKSTIHYPGLSVTQAAKVIKLHFPDLVLGGITIFTRKNESNRILHKMKSGIEFFVSQIIYETANMKCILLNLAKLCQKTKYCLPRIYLSLAPAEKKTDIEFLQWLGVEFPTVLLSYFMEGDDRRVAARVDEMIDCVLQEIHDFISREHFNLGFNVEQIMYHNQASAINLIHHIKQRLEECL